MGGRHSPRPSPALLARKGLAGTCRSSGNSSLVTCVACLSCISTVVRRPPLRRARLLCLCSPASRIFIPTCPSPVSKASLRDSDTPPTLLSLLELIALSNLLTHFQSSYDPPSIALKSFLYGHRHPLYMV